MEPAIRSSTHRLTIRTRGDASAGKLTAVAPGVTKDVQTTLNHLLRHRRCVATAIAWSFATSIDTVSYGIDSGETTSSTRTGTCKLRLF